MSRETTPTISSIAPDGLAKILHDYNFNREKSYVFASLRPRSKAIIAVEALDSSSKHDFVALVNAFLNNSVEFTINNFSEKKNIPEYRAFASVLSHLKKSNLPQNSLANQVRKLNAGHILTAKNFNIICNPEVNAARIVAHFIKQDENDWNCGASLSVLSRHTNLDNSSNRLALKGCFKVSEDTHKLHSDFQKSCDTDGGSMSQDSFNRFIIEHTPKSAAPSNTMALFAFSQALSSHDEKKSASTSTGEVELRDKNPGLS